MELEAEGGAAFYLSATHASVFCLTCLFVCFWSLSNVYTFGWTVSGQEMQPDKCREARRENVKWLKNKLTRWYCIELEASTGLPPLCLVVLTGRSHGSSPPLHHYILLSFFFYRDKAAWQESTIILLIQWDYFTLFSKESAFGYVRIISPFSFLCKKGLHVHSWVERPDTFSSLLIQFFHLTAPLWSSSDTQTSIILLSSEIHPSSSIWIYASFIHSSITICLSICYLSIYPSICSSSRIHLITLHSSIYPYLLSSFRPSIQPTIHSSIHLSILSSFHPSIAFNVGSPLFLSLK